MKKNLNEKELIAVNGASVLPLSNIERLLGVLGSRKLSNIIPNIRPRGIVFSRSSSDDCNCKCDCVDPGSSICDCNCNCDYDCK